MSHPREHEAILQECLAADDPLLALGRSASSGCAVCKDRVDDLMNVTEALAELRRDIDSSAADRRPVAGEGLVEELLGARLRARRRSRRLALAAGAAAAAAVILAAPFLVARLSEPAKTTLGPAGLRLHELEHDGERVTFTWSAELPAGGRYEIRVLRADDSRELARSSTETPRWTTTTKDWPNEILWRVDVLDAAGTLVESRSQGYSSSR